MMDGLVSEGVFWGLVLLSAGTSFLTATLGAGGGVVMIAAMAVLLPPAALIPVHGMVQLGSNLGRASMSWRHIHWPTMVVFAPFSILGAIVASLVLLQLPVTVVQLTIALFILYLCWGPKLPSVALKRRGLAVAASITGFLALFIGASGPLVGAFIKTRFIDRYQVVATFAATMSVQHIPKAFVFGFAGFVFADWWLLIALMIVAGLIGTWLGLHTLGKISDKRFDLLFKLVLSILALRLLYQALLQ